MTELIMSLEAFGLWALLVLVVAKFVTGVLAAVYSNTFQWTKIGNVLKNDGVKFVTVAVLAFINPVPALVAATAALLATDLTAGVVKNVADIFPNIAGKLPDSATGAGDG